ncbi:GNAT family N-acetyltransferase [candidate division KSB1 bacterium]
MQKNDIKKTGTAELERLIEPFAQDPDSLQAHPAEARNLLKSVEKIIDSGSAAAVDREIWHSYLCHTGRPQFLLSLGDAEARYRWADTTFAIIAASEFTLHSLFKQRAGLYGQKALFHEMRELVPYTWSYERVADYTRRIAASFFTNSPSPRVGIYLENSAEGACTDLACLMYDIFVVPLNVHFDAETLVRITNRLGLNTFVTDTEERLHCLAEVQAQTETPATIFVTDEKNRALRDTDLYLGEACSRLSLKETEALLGQRERVSQHDIITTMFTSGSTGKPKGISFTGYNLITKRFARAAALPSVGINEVILCYLPLFHTFGRYLEMMGMIYWGGTYVFAGIPSAETLLARIRQVRPTGLIGVPLRWTQLRDHCLEKAGAASSDEHQKVVFRQIAGDRLRWGLSAAGYLDPKVFRFFQRNGVELCSGFGMTEATGGITMTPPGDYHDNSVGIPLPGIRTKFSKEKELHVSGPYIARYLDDLDNKKGDGQSRLRDEEYWLPTGDLFNVRSNGHCEIIDRIKDIYKNNKGQTVAPRKVEKKFEGVPGIKRTFLVGDGRDYNVLLIVPDSEELMLKELTSEEDTFTYYNKIVTEANQEIAPYERVVNIAVLDRDFDLNRGELTPKESFKRKKIEQNFSQLIDQLYRSNYIEIPFKKYRIQIPRWFFRDLGILESDIAAHDKGIYNKTSKSTLSIDIHSKPGTILIGDLEYSLRGEIIDMGLFARHPLLWSGNPELIAFCPCKEGWDLPLGPVSAQVFLPFRSSTGGEYKGSPQLLNIRNQHLIWINGLFYKALHGAQPDSLSAIGQLEKILSDADDRIASVIRSRLEALARHPDEQIRCTAYKILLLDEPMPDYSKVFPAFIESGLSFLNEETINAIAHTNIEKRRLDALRKRLHQYRTQLQWPAAPVVRQQFENIFTLIANFAKARWEYYEPVRAELAIWIHHRSDSTLSRAAERILLDLVTWFEHDLASKTPVYEKSYWLERLVLDEQISEYEITFIKKVFVGTTFLHESIMLAFDVEKFDLSMIPPGGIWISRILSQRHYHRYRVSVNTTTGDHYDILLTLREDFQEKAVMESLYWLIAIGGYPYGLSPAPRFGCCRPELGALSVVYVSDLTVWERIREYNSMRDSAFAKPGKNFLKKLFIRAIAAYFTELRNSGFKILPEYITTVNTVVPEPDFRKGATILTLIGWKPYENTLSLIRPVIKNFYQKTAAHYPWTRSTLDYSWIFDACTEELGIDETERFLKELKKDLLKDTANDIERELLRIIDRYYRDLNEKYYVPLPVRNAIDRYSEWQSINKGATKEACAEIVTELYRLYRIDLYPETARYYLYRHTYFSQAKHKVQKSFDYLLDAMFRNPGIPATSMMELSELQSTLDDTYDRTLFGKLVFPRAETAADLDIFTIGDSDKKQVIVQSKIASKEGITYFIREPIEPSEIGHLYRMFLAQHFPKTISQQDKFYIAVDTFERVIGGVSYKLTGNDVAHIDGIVIAGQLMNKGLGSALLEDFCTRMKNQGIKAVKTHFYLHDFYLARNFKIDKRWGGLVRFLAPVEPKVPDIRAISARAGDKPDNAH